MAAGSITVLKHNVPWGPFTRTQIDEALRRGDFTVQYLAHAAGLPEWLPLGEVLDYAARHEAALSPALPPVPGPRVFPAAPAPPKPSSPPVTPFWTAPNSVATTPAAEPVPPPAIVALSPTPGVVAPSTAPRPPMLPEKVAATVEPPKPPPAVVVPAPVSASVTSPDRPVFDAKPAPFFFRFIAFLVDCGIVFLPVAGLYLVGVLSIEGPTLWRHTNHQTISEEWALLRLNVERLCELVLVMAWLYGAGMESSRRQATIGKRWLGLKVTDARGERMTFLRATGRYAAKYLSALPCFLGFIIALFSSRGLALHDRLSGSRVERAAHVP